STAVSSGPTLVRFGPWAISRDTKDREGVPGAESALPESSVLTEALRKAAPAIQFGEVLHFHGDDFVTNATVNALARMSRRPIQEVDGNPDLSEAYLFGGLVENPDTNRFEPWSGVVAEAMAEGKLLVIRNASRLPPEIRARLATIAGN